MTEPNDDNLEDAIERVLSELHAELSWWHETHGSGFRDLLETAGITGHKREQIELVWERVVLTQQNVLLHLIGLPIKGGKPQSRRDYPAETGALYNPTPTVEQLAQGMTTKELKDLVSACRTSATDCSWALGQLRDAGGPTDYWLGTDSPTYALSRYRDWFVQVEQLGKEARKREPHSRSTTSGVQTSGTSRQEATTE